MILSRQEKMLSHSAFSVHNGINDCKSVIGKSVVIAFDLESLGSRPPIQDHRLVYEPKSYALTYCRIKLRE